MTLSACAEHHGELFLPTILAFATAVYMMDIYGWYSLMVQEVAEHTEMVVPLTGNSILPSPVHSQLSLLVLLCLHPCFPTELRERTRHHLHPLINGMLAW